MRIMLGPDAQRLIEQKLTTGRYASVEDVVLAALQALSMIADDDFPPGELAGLIERGEASIRTHGTLDGQEAYRARCRRHESR